MNTLFSQVLSLWRFYTEGETTTPPLSNGINDVNKSHDISSAGNSQGKTQGPENYVSSVRTVGLCVSTCWIIYTRCTLQFHLENHNLKSKQSIFFRCSRRWHLVLVWVLKMELARRQSFLLGMFQQLLCFLATPFCWKDKFPKQFCFSLFLFWHQLLLELVSSLTAYHILTVSTYPSRSFQNLVYLTCEYFTFRYLLEQSLSVDNLFVFVLIFKYFKVPLMYQVLIRGHHSFSFYLYIQLGVGFFL